jgi:hypothetical protein
MLQLEIAEHGLAGTEWRDDAFDFWAFDRRCDELAGCGEPLRVAREIAGEVAIRTQRLAPRITIDAPWFARVLAEHRALHDLDKPLVRADHDHALDAWQWTLRLDPTAPPEVQLAALLHDVERLVSEADARVEHLAADYRAFKDAHARAGAELARRLLARAGVPEDLAGEACRLVAVHERPDGSPELDAVNDADALSFFSLNSPGYLRYFGADQTRAKVAYTLARMSPRARGWLRAIRMPRGVAEQVHLA